MNNECFAHYFIEWVASTRRMICGSPKLYSVCLVPERSRRPATGYSWLSLVEWLVSRVEPAPANGGEFP
jgi:hypothetical protein